MIGEAIGPFAIRSSLGRGGFGEVWLAEHRETGDRVAIKVMTPEVSALPVVVDMVADARAIARVVHHGIARIYDAGVTATKRAYIITELVIGERLDARIAKGRFSSTQVADVIQQMASAMKSVHGANLVHHDLKPANVMFVSGDARERVVVLDFGLSKLVGAAPEHATPAYLAPEQFGGARPDWRADIYALGCLAFTMATGQAPFAGASFEKVRGKVLKDPPPTVRSIAPDAGGVLDKLVARMLEKAPEERPQATRDISKLFDMIVGIEAPLAETVE